MRNIAAVNPIPYLLFRFKKAKFVWENKEELRGRLNGGLVQLEKLPLWVIFLLKTLPIIFITALVSNNFFLLRQFFLLNEKEQIVGLIYSLSVIFMFYSVYFYKGNLQFLYIIASILIFVFLNSSLLDKANLLEIGLGASFYLIIIFYSFVDILLILISDKEMYYIKKAGKRARLEGTFITLYADQFYLKEGEEIKNEEYL